MLTGLTLVNTFFIFHGDTKLTIYLYDCHDNIDTNNIIVEQSRYTDEMK